MHRENFFKPLESIMSRWKWRASWGRTGNNNLSVANSRGEYKITDTNYQGSVGILNTTKILNYDGKRRNRMISESISDFLIIDWDY